MDQKISEILDQLQKGVAQVGPDAWDALLCAVQMQATVKLGAAGVGLLFCVVTLAVIARKGKGWYDAAKKEFLEPFVGSFLCMVAVAGLIAGAVSVQTLVTASNWISALDPKAGIAWLIAERLMTK